MAEHPAASGQMLIALDFHLGPATEVAVIGGRDAGETRRAIARDPARVPAEPGGRVPRPATGPPPESIPLLEGQAGGGREGDGLRLRELRLPGAAGRRGGGGRAIRLTS